MAEASVGIKFSAAEYRFVRTELELWVKELYQKEKAAKLGKEKTDLRARKHHLTLILEKI